MNELFGGDGQVFINSENGNRIPIAKGGGVIRLREAQASPELKN